MALNVLNYDVLIFLALMKDEKAAPPPKIQLNLLDYDNLLITNSSSTLCLTAVPRQFNFLYWINKLSRIETVKCNCICRTQKHIHIQFWLSKRS